MQKRSLDQWLALLETRHPREIELGLSRIAEVAGRLQLPAPARRVVSVAGTNGKGSFVRVLEALAGAWGCRTGVYTSPHIRVYNERIRIDGVEVGDTALVDAFERIEAARGDTPLTYFETGTLAALLLMAETDLDVAVLEVGLGGRLDAVNLVDADLAVITAIDVDHSQWLGEDRETIALEKAGIVRPGGRVVCADPDPPVSLLGRLSEFDVASSRLGEDFGYEIKAGGGDNAPSVDVWLCDPSGQPLALAGLPCPDLPVESAVAALQASLILGVLPPAAVVADIFARVSLVGRFQRLIVSGRRLVLDVAHNPAAATYLAKRLAAEGGRVVAVAAIMADKDRAGFVAALDPTIDHWYLGELADNPRACPARELAAVVYNAGGSASTCATVAEALFRALEESRPDDLVVVCGSFHTVGAAIAAIEASTEARKEILSP